MNNKLYLSNDVVDFMTSFNMLKSLSKNGECTIYYIDAIFKATDDPNVFEIIHQADLIENYAINNETTNN